MDYIAFEPFCENDAFPSPQPSLSIPLKSNIENLGAKLSHFNNLKLLLKLNTDLDTKEEVVNTKLAEKYALLSLRQISSRGDHKPVESPDLENALGRSDALSARLSRGLNPSFGDSAMRDLFVRLEASNESSIDLLVDPGIEGSIARKSLRTQAEADLIKHFSSTLTEYMKPVNALKTLGERVSALVVSINETKDLLEKDVDLTAELMDTINTLDSQKKSIDLKKNLLVAFRQKFTLSEYERYVLEFNNINQEFFDILKRAEKINQDCLILLALDNPEQGQKLWAKNNESVTKANQKITTFCVRTLSNIYLLGNRERLSVLLSCLKYLTKDQAQLDSVLDSFIRARSTSLLEEFVLQTSGKELSDSQSMSKSRLVFYSSHDPVKYVADLLAYVHSIVANEVETLSNLFEGESSLAVTASGVLERVLNSLAKPIRAEVERTISAETKIQTTFQIFDHLELYHLMFAKIPDAAGINSSIEHAMNLAKQKVELMLSNRLAAARASNLARLDLSSDLQPPDWIIDFYSDTLPILNSMNSATVFNMPRKEHDKFLSLLVNEPIAVFEEHLALESAGFSKQEMMIFKLNFLDLVASKITPIPILKAKVSELDAAKASLLQIARELQLKEILESCSLTDFYNVTNMICPIDKELLDASIYQSITENKLFTRQVVADVYNEIESVLPTALMDTQTALIKLNNPVFVKEIVTGAFEDFAIFYKLFSDLVHEHMKEPLFAWSYEEITTMLGIDKTEHSLY